MDIKSKFKKEDKILKSKVKLADPPNWEAISESLKFKGFSKSSKQCRERLI